MRKSTLFFLFILMNLILVVLMFAHASLSQKLNSVVLQKKGEMSRAMQITDLCLFTEASYTRHLSQADLHTPFQDGPFSLEHFPSGAMVGPPPNLKRINEKLD